MFQLHYCMTMHQILKLCTILMYKFWIYNKPYTKITYRELKNIVIMHWQLSILITPHSPSLVNLPLTVNFNEICTL